MDFAEEIKELAAQLKIKRDYVSTEEATKTSMVMPFLQVLGFDVFDPTEVIPEYTTDYHGLKKDEKIDYVLAINKVPIIIIEVKSARTFLPEKSSQLFKYFAAMKTKFPIKFAMLTNGIQYKFFSDFEQKNIMDEISFLTINIETDIRDSEIAELRKFHKEYFDAEKISDSARNLKYTGVLKRYFKKQFKEPQDEFIKFLIKEAMKPFKIMATKQCVERFSPMVLDAFRQYINEVVTDRSRALLEVAKKAEVGATNEELSEKQILRQRFWTQLLGYAKTKTELHAKISPVDTGWVSVTAGIRGLSFCYSVTKHHATIELYIDKGKDTQEENEKIFDKLAATKEEIEMIFGGPLEWERLEGKRACRIKKIITEGGYLDEGNWPKIHEAMVDAMIRFQKVISPHIQYLRK
jgi:hypothetical protein